MTTLSYQDVLEKLAPSLRRRVDDGAAVEDLAAELCRHGIRVGGVRLRTFLDTGRLDSPEEEETAGQPRGEAVPPAAETPQPE